MANRAAGSQKSRLVLIILGCCCMLAAAALAFYNHWDSRRAEQASQQLAAELAVMLQAGDLSHTPVAEPGQRDEALSQTPVQAEAGEIPRPPAVKVEDYEVCGVLELPSIKVKLAVIQDWSYPNLAISACRYSGAPDGQMIILAHNYRGHFGDLPQVKVGESLRFTDVEGTVYDYTVAGIEIWAENQLQEIISGDTWDLTLFTCTYGRTNRVVVRCIRA